MQLPQPTSSESTRTLFDKIGGRDGLYKAVDAFYDKVYAHPWLSKFFAGITQEHISAQQTDFMQGVLGGAKVYCGKTPVHAHAHMHITTEVFDLRQELLRQALEELKVDTEVARKWLGLDEAFRGKLVKSLECCKVRPGMNEILDIPPLN